MPGISPVIAAAVTPRNPCEEVDFGAAFELLDFLGKGGVNGIALFTATGEYPALDAGERARLLYLAVKRSRAPLLVGIGAATLSASLSLAREACDAGAAALLLPPPHFFRYDQEDLREFYLQFSAQASTRTPVYIMNSPQVTTPIDPETLRDLLATQRFAGLAENISELACAVPEIAVSCGDDAAVKARVREFEAWAAQFPPTVALKAALNLRGLKTGPFHVPLTAQKQRLLEEYREWFGGWLAEVKRAAAHA